jgi:hypothetical protein
MTSVSLPRILGSILFVLLSFSALAPAGAEIPRRKDQFGKDFGYYLYPIVGEVPGLGRAWGGGASVLNIAGNDADFTGYYLTGDFTARGAALLDVHLIRHRLILDGGYNDYEVAPKVYERGIESDPDNAIYPEAEGRYFLGQLTLTFDDRRYEFYVRPLTGRERFTRIFDSDGKPFENIDTSWQRRTSYAIGGTIDLTDDRLDPRRGGRFEYLVRLPAHNPSDESEFFVMDYNFTGYVPVRKWDTLVFNVYHSRAIVTREGETDFATLQQTKGLDCGQYPPGEDRDNCLQTEERLINNFIANNRHGTASPLGGTQRLRSYDNYRYYSAQALSYGVEYRWNLTDEYTPFNYYFARGIRTGLQIAAFWERGMVAENTPGLFKDGRQSYGVGFRLLLSGVVIRLDFAAGSEGGQTQIFITYPWSMFSVDNPG